jgi:hypothetical protein
MICLKSCMNLLWIYNAVDDAIFSMGEDVTAFSEEIVDSRYC